jgi:hypothetical protein
VKPAEIVRPWIAEVGFGVGIGLISWPRERIS